MRSQCVTFGSHGTSHAILTRLDAGAVDDELRVSKGVLERELGEPASLLAYPNGD